MYSLRYSQHCIKVNVMHCLCLLVLLHHHFLLFYDEAFIILLALKLYSMILLMFWHQKMTLFNMHCDCENPECHLKLWAKNMKGNG